MPDSESNDVVAKPIDEFRHGKKDEAAVHINIAYQDHKGDPAFTKDYTARLTQQLQWQHLLPDLAAHLFGTDEQLEKLDVDGDGWIGKGEVRQVLSTKFRERLTPLEQFVASYIELNQERITGKADGYVTGRRIRRYAADQDERSMSAQMARRINAFMANADYKGLVAHLDENEDGVVSPVEINDEITFTRKAMDLDVDPSKRAALEERRDMARFLQKHPEITNAAWDFNGDNMSEKDMAAWASAHADDYQSDRLPNCEITWPGPGIALRNVSDKFASQMRDEYEKFPEVTRDQVQKTGYEVIIAKRVVEELPGLAKGAPSGWPTGSTFENLAGVTNPDPKKIVVAEEEKPVGHREWQKTERGVYALWHEFGHGVNRAWGKHGDYYSNGDQFKAAFEDDLLNIERKCTPEEKQQLQYFFTQPPDHGGDESFAEIFALDNGGTSQCNADLLRKAFPHVRKLLREKLALEEAAFRRQTGHK